MCSSKTHVSVAAPVKEHAPEAWMPGATAQQHTGVVTTALSADRYLLPQNPTGITDLS